MALTLGFRYHYLNESDHYSSCLIVGLLGSYHQILSGHLDLCFLMRVAPFFHAEIFVSFHFCVCCVLEMSPVPPGVFVEVKIVWGFRIRLAIRQNVSSVYMKLKTSCSAPKKHTALSQGAADHWNTQPCGYVCLLHLHPPYAYRERETRIPSAATSTMQCPKILCVCVCV